MFIGNSTTYIMLSSPLQLSSRTRLVRVPFSSPELLAHIEKLKKADA